MTLLIWIVRVLILFIIIRFIVLMVRSALAGASETTGTGTRARVKKRPERLGGTLVQDPECGTYLPADRAITVESRGSVHHFCSVACRDKWQGRA